MLEVLATLLAFQLLGEAVAHLSGWPVPGPVIGMALLFAAWPALTRLHARLGTVSETLLTHFGLLFVPAGVGVMLHADLIAGWWLPLLVGVVASTALTMALAAGLFVWLRRRTGPPAGGDGGGAAPTGAAGNVDTGKAGDAGPRAP